jgi:sigma-B regulation protein RsbU (phosphoserine phosphatase)
LKPQATATVAYTDGITESENRCGELWGQERLEPLLRVCRDCTSAQIVEPILDEILVFGKDCSQKDDVTLVVAAVKDGGVYRLHKTESLYLSCGI